MRRRKHRRFEIEKGAVPVEDQIAIGVADRISIDVFPAVFGVRELADHLIEFPAGVLSAEEQQHQAFSATVVEGREIVDHIVGKDFCRELIAGADTAFKRFGIGFRKRLVRRDHSCRDQFESRPGEQSGDDAACPGFLQRIRSNQHIRKFHSHFFLSLLL